MWVQLRSGFVCAAILLELLPCCFDCYVYCYCMGSVIGLRTRSGLPLTGRALGFRRACFPLSDCSLRSTTSWRRLFKLQRSWSGRSWMDTGHDAVQAKRQTMILNRQGVGLLGGFPKESMAIAKPWRLKRIHSHLALQDHH